ncbi:hypothetical protein CC1G_07118 [Coprinopsis cinerea okayama7|uniref:Uncharacterized protein n=1 Tax=Coprinopsis cinerea (strain Okayama-7 / 130 / ATCC MYA-4618 / FGSC 9003) TaxID=240176 RepID=A8NR38_COPC7|nr:hypothetical protein CC1G_07118 [Coprinopsis cinerea okayama7\|eukprot:XP_001835694.1 hypothetical protein CC1G_07118 [Coprinopsis cinerea okayama7\
MLASKRGLQAITSLARGYATRYPRPRPGTAERPPLKHGDPVTQSRNTTVVNLEDEGLTFVHRPPPSAPSPASLTTAPASPLLRPQSKPAGEVPLPPALHNHPLKERKTLSTEDIAKMKELRASDPVTYSTNKLAKMFGCSRHFVILSTRITTAQRTALEREREAQHEENRERWSDRHKLVKALRARRRQMW